MIRLVPAFCLVPLLGACASIPDVEYSYYPAKSTSAVSVVQTIDCNHDKTALVIVSSPTVNASYTSDYSQKPFKVRLRDVEGAYRGFADSEMEFGFFDDGRLKTINQQTTGQGEAIVKSVVSLVTALTPLGGAGMSTAPAGKTLPECDTIAHWGGDKPVTLNYAKQLDWNGAATTVNLDVDPGSSALYQALEARLPVLQAQLSDYRPIEAGAASVDAAGASNAVNLVLQKTASVRVDVTADGTSIFTGRYAVPTNEQYLLPIPKAALFGKQTFALTLSDSGLITTVKYGKETGAAGAANAVTAVAGARQSAAEAKAAELKAQADLIAAQQRLARCRAKPDECE